MTKFFMSGKYLAISWHEDGQYRWKHVHRLVAEAIYGPCPKGMQVNHIDGNKLNNDPTNLEYVTPKENIQHAFELGLCKRGSQHHLYKHGLSGTKEYQVANAKKWHSNNPARLKELKKRYNNRHKQQISDYNKRYYLENKERISEQRKKS